jgi:hypothetical protein
MKKFLLFLLIVIVVFLYGVIVGNYEIFPYNIMKQLTFLENSNVKSQYSVSDFPISLLIKIHNEDDIKQKRAELINYIWKENTFSRDSKNLNVMSISDTLILNKFSNFSYIEKYEIAMEYGINSTAYYFHSMVNNGNLIIYHQGHGGDFISGNETINKLLSNGYDVISFSMPLHGQNNNPEFFIDNIGKISLQHHNQFYYLDNANFSSIKFFLEPILISLNYIDEKYNYDSYSFIGISGGGWTGILYSAIDERISQTFSVAGSYPIFLRIDSKDMGDYEQIIPDLYTKVNYLELYIMSSVGDGRKLVQVFNENDPCCFSGDSFLIYESYVTNTVNSFEHGSFEILLDSTHNEHIISNFALDRIMKSIYSKK